MSLGVDLIPHKICSLNCIYCECGPTTRLTGERKEYVPVEEVLQELSDFFVRHPDPDYITFSGAGEPTLHSRIGEVLSFIKRHKPGIPVAILTNGTLLRDPGVREELMEADLVMPSLDAATETAFRRINRPSKKENLEEYIEGLVRFSQEYKGQLWLEVMILPGYNDDPENLEALRRAVDRIRTDRIQLNTLDRPGAVEGLQAASRETLEGIAGAWGADRVEIIAPPKKRQHSSAYRKDLENAITETLSRRPSTLEDLEKILGLHPNEINKYLGVLEQKGQIVTSVRDRGIFYLLNTP
jgi:wyosine [tRNA(Phe)-imidazoG37] synthetase (radical SAM superfamily)